MKEYKYTINGKNFEVAIGDIKDDIAVVTVNGQEYKVEMEPEPVEEKPQVVVRPVAPQPAAAPKENASSRFSSNAVKAPLPGVIVDIKVSVGDNVDINQTVVVLEAMKMNNNLETEIAGTVKEICVQPGQSVMEGDPLVIIE